MVELSVLFLITSNFRRRDPWFRSFIGRSLFSQRKLGKKKHVTIFPPKSCSIPFSSKITIHLCNIMLYLYKIMCFHVAMHSDLFWINSNFWSETSIVRDNSPSSWDYSPSFQRGRDVRGRAVPRASWLAPHSYASIHERVNYRYDELTDWWHTCAHMTGYRTCTKSGEFR